MLTTPPDAVEGGDFYEFIGLMRPKLRIYPRTGHIAEKLHAYTIPRKPDNSRVKALPNIALLGRRVPTKAQT